MINKLISIIRAEMNWKRKIAFVVWLILMAFGLLGLLQRLTGGHLQAGYGSYIPWGIWVAIYFYGAGLSAGIFVVEALRFLLASPDRKDIAGLRRAMVLSTAALLPGLLAIGLDLGQMFRGAFVFLSPSFSSILTINAWLYQIYLFILLVGWLLSWRSESSWFNAVLIWGVVICCSFAAGSGMFFGAVTVKHDWSGAVWPIVTLVSAISSGAALMLLLGRGNEKSANSANASDLFVRNVLFAGIAIYFLISLFQIISQHWYRGEELGATVSSPLLLPKWVFLLFGCILPILLFSTSSRFCWRLAGLLVFVFLFESRISLVLAGQPPLEMPELVDAFHHNRLLFFYVPTLMEIQVSFLLLAISMAIYAVGTVINLIAADYLPPLMEKFGMGFSKENDSSRRDFIAKGALLGTAAFIDPFSSLAFATRGTGKIFNSKRANFSNFPTASDYIYSCCLNCNTGCGIKCKLEDGVLTKIDGNPYNPWTLVPHIDASTSVTEAAHIDGAICPKGQAGLQIAYDPYRIRKVLKRAGKRGENKWISIPFEQAVKEICEGGKLFANVPGEEERNVEGLKDILALRDPSVSKAMADDVKAIWEESDREKKKKMVEEFKKKHASHLDKLIDPEHPDLGAKNNQLILAFGRIKSGREELYKRFANAAGTENLHGHTTVCQGSLYFTCRAISEQYDIKTGKFEGGKKFYWQADIEYSKFILFVGANLFEANYGPPNRTARLTKNLVSGYTKIACADPRFSKLASKSWKWLPLKPGTDTALAMAIIRWMLDNERFDKRSVSCANKAAANAINETSWTNATLLVKIENGKPSKFLRAKEIGLSDGNELVALVNGAQVAVNPNDDKNPVYGDLYVNTTLPNGVSVKTGLELLKEECHRFTIEEWCSISDVKTDDLVGVAKELTSHGKMAAVDIHRGPAQHTNGFYNVLAWMTINMLLGNFDFKGGMCKASKWDTDGKGGWFNLNEHPGKPEHFGVSSIRHNVDYEKTTIFDAYPAKRNWYPLASAIYEEIIPSIGDRYPYPAKALFMYMGAPTYALPAAHTNIEILCDLEKVPLFVANDIVIGSTSLYADYIFPDTSYLERWEFHKSHPNMTWKVNPIRQPVIAPIPEDCTVFGEKQPICFETMLMGIAEYLKLPGFGENAFGEGKHLRHLDDFMLRCVGNIAYGEKTDGSQIVPDADLNEIKIFKKSRRHLPSTVFDYERWKSVVGEKMMPKVVYVLNRGGRYEDYKDGYKGDKLAHPYANMLCLYQEKTASKIHSGTGEHHPGLATWVPVRNYHGKEPENLRKGYDLAMITNRTITQTKSRTVASPWLTTIMPENKIQISPLDASRLGIADGQKVKVVSATNQEGEWILGNGLRKSMIGVVQVTNQVRPGVISFALGFGHWATGASDIIIDGTRIKGEPRRAAGLHANAAMWVDPVLKNTCMIDPVGGSVSFYDTYVKLVKV